MTNNNQAQFTHSQITEGMKNAVRRMQAQGQIEGMLMAVHLVRLMAKGADGAKPGQLADAIKGVDVKAIESLLDHVAEGIIETAVGRAREHCPDFDLDSMLASIRVDRQVM